MKKAILVAMILTACSKTQESAPTVAQDQSSQELPVDATATSVDVTETSVDVTKSAE